MLSCLSPLIEWTEIILRFHLVGDQLYNVLTRWFNKGMKDEQKIYKIQIMKEKLPKW